MNDLRIIENELVPVYETDKGIKVVYGTELHEVLGVKSRFADWVKNRFDDCEAVENKDFESFSKILEKGGRPQIEYIIKLETAKEMAMLERNDKGKEVRKYFISVEEKYKQEIVDRQQLSPLMQSLVGLVELQAKQELEQKRQAEQLNRIEKRQDAISEAMKPVTDNWREEINKKVKRIQFACKRDFKELTSEMYSDLQCRAGCDLSTRLRNKKQRMHDAGCTKTEIENTRKIDIIEEDKRLREIFTKIVSEYEIKYCA